MANNNVYITCKCGTIITLTGYETENVVCPKCSDIIVVKE